MFEQAEVQTIHADSSKFNHNAKLLASYHNFFFDQEHPPPSEIFQNQHQHLIITSLYLQKSDNIVIVVSQNIPIKPKKALKSFFVLGTAKFWTAEIFPSSFLLLVVYSIPIPKSIVSIIIIRVDRLWSSLIKWQAHKELKHLQFT